MKSVFFRFISAIYLKSFFIIFLALVLFFVGVDLVINFKDLPSSANLVLLYTLFLACMAINYVLPISLVFALIFSMISMVRSNELVSFYALGLSKRLVILYPFLWALFFYAVFVGLNFTPFAYAEDYKDNIIANAVMSGQSKDIFLKYDDKFVYIAKLESLEDRVDNMKIFDLANLELTQLRDVKSAIFKDNAWLLERGEKISVPNSVQLFGEGLQVENIENIKALSGFKPRIIESVANKSHYSIADALQSLFAFSKQGVNTALMRIELYKLIFMPLFAPFLLLILYHFFPTISRFFNLAFISFVFFLCTLGLWGVLYLLAKFAENGFVSPEIGLIAPICLLIAISLFLFYKKRRFVER